MTVLSIDVFTREQCIFCTNLKVILNKLINQGLIKFNINYINANANESVPYIIKYCDNKKPQKLIGFPERKKLYKFLEIKEINESEIYPETTKKHRKIFTIN